MKVLIIEDEAPAFRRLQKVLEEINPDIEIVEVIDSVDDSIKWIRNHDSPDLIFMDIQLSDGISFEIFDQVDIKSPVIFTTAFDEYVLRAFTALVPTPLSPTDFLKARVSYFPPVFILETTSTTFPKGIPRP